MNKCSEFKVETCLTSRYIELPPYCEWTDLYRGLKICRFDIILINIPRLFSGINSFKIFSDDCSNPK